MSILNLIAYWVAVAVGYIWSGVSLAAIGLGLWALIDAAMRPAAHFVAADKRTKTFWVAVTAAGLAVCALTGFSSMFGLFGCVASAVYLTDVRPALKFYAPVKVRGSIRPIRRDGQSRPDDRGWRR
ncbi:Protein of uncharacterised function (DUF2516) [Actinomyces bovis]|uniref:Protein of uncharacterized function (DUF2516) n=1 Tax=Actinomyces bovis TaxID=1658 RepID=A0ABY1VMW8_9ACTO|nr:DUF2516 family protein [Actinomyces bovis]SPT53031.1 Protein of uncharacterised function (DUF2516) [Actinomyces bovis]VEG55304.1 Protein of uncharacterised function (DUF2516) [Actinomyces israelii]